MPNYEDEYIKGYIGNSETAQWFLGRTQKMKIGTNSMVGDPDSQNFKYFLKNYGDSMVVGENDPGNLNFQYEDPTLLGFEIMLETDTPLFSDSGQKSSAASFLKQYGNIKEIGYRKDILAEFQKILFLIFDKDFNNQNVRNKTYYIESILGVDKLNAMITKYEGINDSSDKLTISLTEDVSMLSLYLAELYNNLAYSYKNQRYLIPENCLRFDMKIKVRDIRNFGLPNPKHKEDPDNEPVFILNTEYISNIIYTIHDCNFDFFNSQNAQQELRVAGFETLNKEHARLSFDIFFKSVSREFAPDLLPNAITLSNKKDNILNDKSSALNKDNALFKTHFGKNTIKEEKTSSDLFRRLKSTLKSELDNAKKILLKNYKEWRGDIVNELFDQIGNKLNVPTLWLGNVYDEDFGKLTLKGFLRSLAARSFADVTGSINSGIDGLEQRGIDPVDKGLGSILGP